MDRIEEIRALLKSSGGRKTAVNSELPPKPEIELLVDGKLKLSQVPESGLKVRLAYADFKERDRVVFNLASQSLAYEAEWTLDGPGVITTTVPKDFVEQLLGDYALAVYFIYRPGDDKDSDWEFFEVIA